MTKKKQMVLVTIAAVGLAGCVPTGGSSSTASSSLEAVSSSSEEGIASSESAASSITASSSSTTSSVVSDTGKIDDLMAELHQAELALTGELNIAFYYAGTPLLLQETTTKQTVAFGQDYYYNAVQEGDQLSYSEYYKTSDGYVATRTLLPTNQVRESIIVGENGLPYSYDASFYNFFDFIDAAECEIDEDGNVAVTGLTDDDKYELTYGLTFYQDVPFTSLTFSFGEDGTITGLLTGEDLGASTGTGITYDMKATMSFTLTTAEEVGFEPVEPFAPKAEDAALDALFANLRGGNFTIDIVKTGGLDQGGDPQRWYLSDNAVLRINLDDESLEAKSGYGYYDTGEGLNYVTYLNGKLEGSKNIDTGTALADMKPTFLFAAAAFDYEGEDTYRLKTGYGFEAYVAATLPDAVANWDNQYYMNIDDGSLTIKLNDDGTAVFGYSYSYLDYGNTVTGTVEATVSAVGTTTTPYAYEAYVEPDYTQWSGYGEETVAILEQYIGDGLKYLPVLDASTAKTSKATEIDRYDGHYISITNTYNDAEEALAVYEAYKALLLENGWVLDPAYDEGRGFYCHERVGGGYYHISFNNTSKYIYFKVFQPTIDFNEWYHGYFDETIGSWFNYTTTVETYDYDETTGTAGETATSTTTTKIVDKMTEGIVKRSVNSKETVTYYEDTENDQFLVIEKGTDNKWYLAESYDGLDTTNLETYEGKDYVTPKDLAPYMDRCTAGENDGEFVLADGDAAALAELLFGAELSDKATANVLLNYYENCLEITFVDEVIADGVLTKTTYDLIINHVALPGTVTAPAYTIPE